MVAKVMLRRFFLERDPVHILFLNVISKNIKFKKDGLFYDLGCGDGFITYSLARKFNLTGIGVDISKNQIDTAKKFFACERVEYLQADLWDFLRSKSIWNKKADYILLVNVILLIDFNDELTNLIYANLKSKGTLVIITPNVDSLNYRLYKLRGGKNTIELKVDFIIEKIINSKLFTLKKKVPLGFFPHYLLSSKIKLFFYMPLEKIFTFLGVNRMKPSYFLLEFIRRE